uniref:Uncharacterized protein n=1 Tax=Caenorhabditis japonica TaxID=281687 RepID=A0A8R1IU05_CAEJA
MLNSKTDQPGTINFYGAHKAILCDAIRWMDGWMDRQMGES